MMGSESNTFIDKLTPIIKEKERLKKDIQNRVVAFQARTTLSKSSVFEVNHVVNFPLLEHGLYLNFPCLVPARGASYNFSFKAEVKILRDQKYVNNFNLVKSYSFPCGANINKTILAQIPIHTYDLKRFYPELKTGDVLHIKISRDEFDMVKGDIKIANHYLSYGKIQ